MTWLGALNFVVLQWFGVRLARCYRTAARSEAVTVEGLRCFDEWTERVHSYRVRRWIVPLTGWWSEYRWIGRRR